MARAFILVMDSFGIGAALVGLNATGAEAERERAAHLSSGPDTGPLLRTILRLRHDAVMIGRASVVPLPSDLQIRLAAPLAKISDAIVAYLRAMAETLRTGVGSPAIWRRFLTGCSCTSFRPADPRLPPTTTSQASFV